MKDFGLDYLVLSSMANVKKRLIRVYKVFWQIFCELQDQFFKI